VLLVENVPFVVSLNQGAAVMQLSERLEKYFNGHQAVIACYSNAALAPKLARTVANCLRERAASVSVSSWSFAAIYA
jgi:hypothetical protein